MSPKILIVSIYYNRADLVHDSVKSVVDQINDDMCLLLVDDGSKDDTYNQLLKWESDRVLVRRHQNKGFVRSIIEAINSIDSKYVAIHGSGDISLAGRFSKQAETLDRNDQIGVVGCFYIARTLEAHGISKIIRPVIRKETVLMLKTNPFSHGEVMFRRSFYEQVGGYREFFTYAQDRDLWARMSQICRFSVVQEVLYERLAYLSDSVSGDPLKNIAQRRLSAFATYCHRKRLVDRYDPLERLGPSAFSNFKPGFSLSYDFFKKSIRSLMVDKPDSYNAYKNACRSLTRTYDLFFWLSETFPIAIRLSVKISGKKFIQ
jgi:glycosyltransferase involved in cell wall biosynthesis